MGYCSAQGPTPTFIRARRVVAFPKSYTAPRSKGHGTQEFKRAVTARGTLSLSQMRSPVGVKRVRRRNDGGLYEGE